MISNIGTKLLYFHSAIVQSSSTLLAIIVAGIIFKTQYHESGLRETRFRKQELYKNLLQYYPKLNALPEHKRPKDIEDKGNILKTKLDNKPLDTDVIKYQAICDYARYHNMEWRDIANRTNLQAEVIAMFMLLISIVSSSVYMICTVNSLHPYCTLISLSTLLSAIYFLFYSILHIVPIKANNMLREMDFSINVE
ncbi:MAG: hypothetical protein V2A56_10665 [bacterium]